MIEAERFDPTTHPAYRELRQAIAELSLISHAPIQGYNLVEGGGSPERWRTRAVCGQCRRQGLEACEHRAPVPHVGAHQAKGGDTAIPRGTDVDRPHRDAPNDEKQAWFDSYQRKRPDHFRRELARCDSVERLEALRDDCRRVIAAWKVGPLGGVEPQSRSDPRWKRWVYESKESSAVLAYRFGVSQRYINMVRQREGVLVWLEQAEARKREQAA